MKKKKTALAKITRPSPEGVFPRKRLFRKLDRAVSGPVTFITGPPGSGKTMLAKRMPSIMPPMTLSEALETTKIHSVAGKIHNKGGLMTNRPFRSPHHLASQVAIVGGGANPQPGEISLAHNGILFLDELPEFGRGVLEVMRQPLEDKIITIARAKNTIEYPSNFMFIASMNPCPCGYFNHPTKKCQCTSGQVNRYMNKISGPLLDRIDIHIEVIPVSFDELKSISKDRKSETSQNVRERVIKARNHQTKRFAESKTHSNSMMTQNEIKKYCQLDDNCNKLVDNAMQRLSLSARAYNRILKLSRTIADLAGSEDIKAEHISEAIQYRALDRENWGV